MSSLLGCWYLRAKWPRLDDHGSSNFKDKIVVLLDNFKVPIHGLECKIRPGTRGVSSSTQWSQCSRIGGAHVLEFWSQLYNASLASYKSFFFSEIKTDSWLVCLQNVHKQLLHLSVLLSFCHCNLVEWKLLLFCFANLQIHFVGLLLFTRIQFLPRNNLLLPHQGLDQSLMIHVRILGRKEVVLEMFPGHLWLHKGCKHKQVFLCSLTTSYSFSSKL